MRLTGYSYLRKREILALVIIVILASAVFTVTAVTLLGFHTSFTSYLGRKENVLLIYDRSSTTPYTGLIPSDLAKEASKVEGVSAVSPEATAPIMVGGEPVFVRGVVPGRFGEFSKIRITEGSELAYEDVSSALLGEDVARRLSLQPGDLLVASSTRAERYALLIVKGIYRSGSFLDSEILVPLYQGQWLRGTDQNHITLARVKYDGDQVSSSSLLLQLVGKKGQSGEGKKREERCSWEIVPISEISVGRGNVGTSSSREFMERYLEEFGTTQGSLLALSIAVFVFTGAGTVVACKYLVGRHTAEISILRSLGASRRTLEADLLTKLLPWFLLSSLAGLGLGYGITFALRAGGCLRSLAHTIPISLNPFLIVALFSASAGMAAISVWMASQGLEEI